MNRSVALLLLVVHRELHPFLVKSFEESVTSEAILASQLHFSTPIGPSSDAIDLLLSIHHVLVLKIHSFDLPQVCVLREPFQLHCQHLNILIRLGCLITHYLWLIYCWSKAFHQSW
jgi:hypothetical protein